MLRSAALILVVLCSASLHARERDWERLNEISDRAKACDEISIGMLIDESVGTSPLGADEAQALSEANEGVFLNCPIPFLRSLNNRSQAGQERLVRLHFGTFHDPWVHGAVLRRLVDHPEVGALVRRQFSPYLEAEAPSAPQIADQQAHSR